METVPGARPGLLEAFLGLAGFGGGLWGRFRFLAGLRHASIAPAAATATGEHRGPG